MAGGLHQHGINICSYKWGETKQRKQEDTSAWRRGRKRLGVEREHHTKAWSGVKEHRSAMFTNIALNHSKRFHQKSKGADGWMSRVINIQKPPQVELYSSILSLHHRSLSAVCLLCIKELLAVPLLIKLGWAALCLVISLALRSSVSTPTRAPSPPLSRLASPHRVYAAYREPVSLISVNLTGFWDKCREQLLQ